MKHLITLTVLVFAFVVFASGQHKSIDFLDDQLNVVGPTQPSKYYRESEKSNDGTYEATIFFMDGKKRMEGTYIDEDISVEHGDFTYYFHSGQKESQGSYDKGSKVGIWKRWDWEGNSKPERYYPGEVEDLHEKFAAQPAEFPGGHDELKKFIRKNLNYPENAKKLALNGEVKVAFIIDDNGTIHNIEVIEGIHYLLDKEAMRLVESMPKWKPASRANMPVGSKFILPIRFNPGLTSSIN